MARKRRRLRSRKYYKTRHPAKTLVLGSYRKTSSRKPYKKQTKTLRNLTRVKKQVFLSKVRKKLLGLANTRPGLAFKKMPLISAPMRKKTICEKRSIRKQVLHAIRKTGKTGQKRPVRKNPDIICRRK